MHQDIEKYTLPFQTWKDPSLTEEPATFFTTSSSIPSGALFSS